MSKRERNRKNLRSFDKQNRLFCEKKQEPKTIQFWFLFGYFVCSHSLHTHYIMWCFVLCCYEQNRAEKQKSLSAHCALIINIHSRFLLVYLGVFLALIQAAEYLEHEQRHGDEERERQLKLGAFALFRYSFGKDNETISQANWTNAKILILSCVPEMYLLLSIPFHSFGICSFPSHSQSVLLFQIKRKRMREIL